ncbi:bone morphogenetic protein 3 [Brienomyrus brachyistius]|uniref:bone morphogenetic protein 3 n=1 Tax=Brienomyrus brachyistius TaxID=42636 RepID=UPI0020B4549D|nr:bone morphogenetic protein 3 [Brienomyrus brachyistius]
MAPCQHLLVIFLGWIYICSGYRFMLDEHLPGLKRKAEMGQFEENRDDDRFAKDEGDLVLQETVSEHMQMLYEKYNSAGFHFKDGNTVRSFKAHWGTVNGIQMQIFNLTSLTKSEDIISATLHYFIGGLQNSSSRCTRPQSCSQRSSKQTYIQLGIWSSASLDNDTRTLGHVRIRVPAAHRDVTSWQWKDITSFMKKAKHHNELLIGIKVPSDGHKLWNELLLGPPPYILVYANDSDISGPENVVSALQGGHKDPVRPGLHRLGVHLSASTMPLRSRRSADTLLPLQNNELPGNEYPYEVPHWDETDPYNPIDNRPAKQPKKKPRKNHRHKVPLLQFDDQTIQRAHKKQWSEPRNCARRYLKVDFADIGWSEWIISPKSFDAYYCSGSCQFPMPKSLKPSNHATIQSIVRAVGVVPGIPEPCCVPERMSPLSILFFDQDKNVVLKVYPNMTVDSCVCR